MEDVEVRRNVWDLLSSMDGLEPLKQLFWTELNYERINTPLSRHGWPERANNALAEDPVLFAGYGAFHIIYNRLNRDRLLLGLERPVINHLIKDHDRALFIFSDSEQKQWHFANAKYETAAEGRATKRRILRRITVGPNERLRTAAQRVSMLDTSSITPDLFGLNALAIQQRHDEAFDVEAVTKEFFEKYKAIFKGIQDQLSLQTEDREWAHDYSLQFLNRMMFIYFIQRKRWIDEDPDFVPNFWKAYRLSGQPKDTFFSDWLEVMFFEAFNRKFQAGRSDRQHIPGDIRRALSMAPYLNGGLFSRNALDNKYSFKVPDTVFGMLFDKFDGRSPGFMEAHNFTIREDSPFDQEVAVDPEMIGKVYESLVNVTFENREEDLRGTAGIFYTPRVEIDLMCRLSLVDWFTNHLGQKHKQLIYEVVFAYDTDEHQEADADVTKAGLWERLDVLLKEVAVLDPACGSGSFLVGMLTVLDSLQERAGQQLDIEETPYERRKRIIGQNLYGVDVMSWAVHVAELRLWLQLVVETELDPAMLGVEPLLPNLSFKIRPGDSLVQEVGGINFALHRSHTDVPGDLKRRLTRLKKEKLKFFRGDPDVVFRFESDIKKEERSLFQDVLFARKENQQKQINGLTAQIESLPEQLTLQSIQKEEPVQLDLQTEEWKRQRSGIQKELEQTESAYNALREAKEPPFIWDLAFVEIFEGDKGGFDIVVGNPPYVRQEKIAPPCMRENDYTTSDWGRLKKEYKGKLQFSVANAYPAFYQYNPSNGRFQKIDGKSDLYVYFYLHGLSLLNPKGSFCFITSNSWLDVGYGKDLQKFLLKNCRVKMIIDNEGKRSFAQADINTIIALISAPDGESLDNVVRFVMFKVPFEDILSPIIFWDIEGTEGRKNMDGEEGRIHPISQRDLLAEGILISQGDASNSLSLRTGSYIGGKWGGKYLRAPDIFFRILDIGKDNLVVLGKVARVVSVSWSRQGNNSRLMFRKTDALPSGQVIDVLKSPRDASRINLKCDDTHYLLRLKHRLGGS